MGEPTKPPLDLGALKKHVTKSEEPEDIIKPSPDDFEAGLDMSAFADLTPEEMEQLKKQAAEQVFKEQREARKKEFLKQQVAKYRQVIKPGQEIVRMTMDLPGHSDRITIDGTSYFHGVTYNFPMDKYKSIIDIAARAWEHENEVGGANRDAYKGRAPVNAVISPDNPGAHNARLSPVIKF